MLELLMVGRRPTAPGDALIGYYETPNDPTRYTGFYGEVQSQDFIKASTLSSAVGMANYGTAISGADTFPWLKFLIDGKVLYVAKKPIRTGVSRSNIDSAKVVDGQKTVTIAGKVYRVRNLTVQKVSPAAYDGGVDPVMSRGSEWNRLMYNIWDDGTLPASQEGDKWAHYSVADLGHNSYGTMSGQICTIGSTQYYSVKSAGQAFTKVGGNDYTTTGNQAWRPCLELVQ